MIEIKPGYLAQFDALSDLLDLSFGKERIRKTTYRLRENIPHLDDLWFIAEQHGALVGSVQYWPIRVCGHAVSQDALLLGPIAVAPEIRGQGIGKALIETSLSIAATLGHQHVILVGDPGYYAQHGFTMRHTNGLSLPGPFEKERLLSRQINQGAPLLKKADILPAFTVPDHAQKPQYNGQRQPGREQRGFNDLGDTPAVIAL